MSPNLSPPSCCYQKSDAMNSETRVVHSWKFPDRFYASPELTRSIEMFTLRFRSPQLYQTGVLSRQGAPAALIYGPSGTGKWTLVKTMAEELNAHIHPIQNRGTGFDMDRVEDLKKGLEEVYRATIDNPTCTKNLLVIWHDIDDIFPLSSEEDEEDDDDPMVHLFNLFEDLIRRSSCPHRKCIVVATSNNPSNIDKDVVDLLETRIHINLPNASERAEIIDTYLADDLTDPGELAQNLIKATESLSGRDLKRLVYHGAAIAAYSTYKSGDYSKPCPVTDEHLFEALGNVRPSVTEWELTKIVAFHEEHGDRGILGRINQDEDDVAREENQWEEDREQDDSLSSESRSTLVMTPEIDDCSSD
ncbi:P-loop containing nucleoside triphosphate hydrolase protein [Podospora fimiseda]|uniref:P-loop containing nucleoside triphosphate hydrolase protein n=1 Tax=Podospora fimiseda TaxID=252190 RepID=A0AAN7BEY2_9PEZI|nr:P-loop containing nucleoside triphosphate hydrolase protein [Podospora fimiseda]